MIFAERGVANTEETLRAAVNRAVELGINHLVVASNTGNTILPLLKSGLKIVCVTHQVGFKNSGEDEMPASMRASLLACDVKVLTTTHLFGGLERGVINKFSGFGPAYITASTLKMFGQGTKVAVEVAVMALDSGMVPFGEDIIAIGGSGRGADTAIVLRPAHSHRFTDTIIREIICKPYSI
ncbi:MAG: pyruvate kinase alpha/beta domain-containing protein [bacterium]|nr:pyruvate kinase alpha/beta domain-containing protein [bacterium]